MIQLVFTVFDSAAGAYLTPFFMSSRGLAIRSFKAAANDGNHQFGQYPKDYTLFHLGQYDDSDGSFSLVPTPEPMGKAIEYLEPIEQEDLFSAKPERDASSVQPDSSRGNTAE